MRKTPKRRTRRSVAGAAQSLLVLAATCMTVFLVTVALTPPVVVSAKSATHSPQPIKTVGPERAPVTVAVIGDSYTACSGMGGCDGANYTVALNRELGWRFTSNAVGGTGYVNKQGGKTTFGERVDAVIASDPSIVIVQGGGNDIFFLDELPGEVADTMARLKAGLPEAKILVVGPIASVTADGRWSEARDVIREAATTVGVDLFVDPIGDGWFTGENASLIGVDGVHPTDEGHLYMAKMLLEPLRSLRD